MSSCSLLQGIFPTQGSKPGLLYCSQILYQLSHQGSPGECWSLMVRWRPTRPSRTNTKRKTDVLFIAGDWNKKVGGQEIPGVTDKFDLGVKNEAGQGLKRVLLREHLVTANSIFQQYKDDSTHGHYQMVNTKIRLIIFLAAKDGGALYSQQNQDVELTVAQTMSSLMQNSGSNRRK